MDIHDKEQIIRHKKLVDRITGMSLGEPDPVLPSLISSLIIYSPDSLDLDHPEDAEKLQLHFASLLHKYKVIIIYGIHWFDFMTHIMLFFRYLKCKRSSKRESVFRKCLMVNAYVRELRDFREAAYKAKFGS